MAIENNTEAMDAREPQIQYNTLDYVVSVDRIATIGSSVRGIYLYGWDNNYPRKVIETSKRCTDLEAAKGIQSRFVAGNGFPGATAMDVKTDKAVVINSNGLTLYDLLQHCAREKSDINIAIHVNYNALGQKVEFTPIPYDFVRTKIPVKGEKYKRHIISNVFHLENDKQNQWFNPKFESLSQWIEKKTTEVDFSVLECFDFNDDPLVVREQIEMCGGIENYSGQLFYAKRTIDIYQRAIYDSVIDKAQFLAESDIASLSNVQNGYSATTLIKMFVSGDSETELDQMKSKAKNSRGSINTGRMNLVGIPRNADGRMPTQMVENIETPNIDKIAQFQTERAEKGIQKIFQTPTSLFGTDTEGNFATQNMQQAYDFYNSITEPIRQELEIELTKLLKNSIFAGQIKLPIEIEPLKYISSYETNEIETNNTIEDDTIIE